MRRCLVLVLLALLLPGLVGLQVLRYPQPRSSGSDHTLVAGQLSSLEVPIKGYFYVEVNGRLVYEGPDPLTRNFYKLMSVLFYGVPVTVVDIRGETRTFYFKPRIYIGFTLYALSVPAPSDVYHAYQLPTGTTIFTVTSGNTYAGVDTSGNYYATLEYVYVAPSNLTIKSLALVASAYYSDGSSAGLGSYLASWDNVTIAVTANSTIVIGYRFVVPPSYSNGIVSCTYQGMNYLLRAGHPYISYAKTGSVSFEIYDASTGSWQLQPHTMIRKEFDSVGLYVYGFIPVTSSQKIRIKVIHKGVTRTSGTVFSSSSICEFKYSSFTAGNPYALNLWIHWGG